MALNDKDIDESMAADWASIQEKYAVEEVEALEPVVEIESKADAETIPVSREADGKFKAKEADKEEKPKVDAKVDKGTTDAKAAKAVPDVVDPNAPADAPQARDTNRAPSTWKPAARAEYEKLSPAIKAEIHRREADFQNGQAQLLPDATFGKGMRQVIDPYRMLIESAGGTPERAVSDLLRTAAILRTGTNQQKYGAIAEVAHLYGIDLRAFSGQQGEQPQPNQEFRDPRVDQMLHQQNLERQQAADREKQTMESTVTRWMNEQDAQGKPKREYLGDVINEMSALVPQIRQNDPTMTHAQALDAAYDRAIWAHPEIRTLLAQKQQTELETQRRADNQKRVSDARKAGSVNVTRRGSVPSPGKPGTMDETIMATARELGMIT